MERLILMLVLGFSCLVIPATAQQENIQITVNSSDHTKAKPEGTWKPSTEISFNSDFVLPNGVDVIHSPTTSVKLRFTNSSEQRTIWLETKTNQVVKRQNYNYHYGFSLGISKEVKKFTFSADAEAGYNRYFNYGRIGGKVAKSFGNDSFHFEPYVRLDLYVPIDNFGKRYTTEKVNTGLSSSFGVESRWRNKSIVLLNDTRFVMDSGSIVHGRRNIMATELEFGFVVGRMCFGPRVAYIKPWSHSNHHLSNGFGGGFFIRYL